MTDQRARAKELYRKLGDVSWSPTIDELETHDIDLILTALADERRRVWEEAARIAMKKAQEPWKSEAANREGLRIAQAIRAKAHADQGGG